MQECTGEESVRHGPVVCQHLHRRGVHGQDHPEAVGTLSDRIVQRNIDDPPLHCQVIYHCQV